MCCLSFNFQRQSKKIIIFAMIAVLKPNTVLIIWLSFSIIQFMMLAFHIEKDQLSGLQRQSSMAGERQ